MSHLTLTQEALSDLETILESLEEQSPQAATNFAKSFEEQRERLSAFPEMGRTRDEVAPGLRSILLKPVFVAFYRVESGRAEIVRILHASRDIDATLLE